MPFYCSLVPLSLRLLGHQEIEPFLAGKRHENEADTNVTNMLPCEGHVGNERLGTVFFFCSPPSLPTSLSPPQTRKLHRVVSGLPMPRVNLGLFDLALFLFVLNKRI